MKKSLALSLCALAGAALVLSCEPVEGEFTDDYPYGEPHKLKIHARGVLAPEEEAASSAGGSKIKFPRDLSARKARKANKYAITF